MHKAVAAFLFLILFAPFRICAEDWGLVKTTDHAVYIHKARSEKSRVMCSLTPGSRVKVDFLEGSWWAAFKLAETQRSEDNALGYIYGPALKPLKGSAMSISPVADEGTKEADKPHKKKHKTGKKKKSKKK